MATIKALEGRTVHQIQSGQVIVDLCSVAKELVENSLDAGATSIEVRFKNNGLDSIEVQDNGAGISSENYETLALKHYTSKLSSYDDLSSLQTFGFRGEALSSLCALSVFHVTTARADEAPKGTRLDFETSGKLKNASVIASQRGTTVTVENLFVNLPVRRRELEKNIKREYGKVLGVLQAYACVSTQARISVSNVTAKAKKAVVFATKSNPTTRENIANVFGARALPGLVSMDLSLKMETTTASISGMDNDNKEVRIVGQVSRPVFGEGRQAPDRQMFFVNARPCGLPQVAKVFNEVYKSYNVSQSPFIFANIVLDTNAYDVNVSPDKRTILLHEQATLLESLRVTLVELFEKQDQTVPQSRHPIPRLPAFKQHSVQRETSTEVQNSSSETKDIRDGPINVESNSFEGAESLEDTSQDTRDANSDTLISDFATRGTIERARQPSPRGAIESGDKCLSKGKLRLIRKLSKSEDLSDQVDESEDLRDLGGVGTTPNNISRTVDDFNQRIAEQQDGAAQGGQKQASSSEAEADQHVSTGPESHAPPPTGVVQNAFDRMRPRRKSPELATITIGSKTTTSVLGSSIFKKRKTDEIPEAFAMSRADINDSSKQKFSSSMQAFAAPGTRLIATVGAPKSKSRPSKIILDDVSDEESRDESVSESSAEPVLSVDDEGEPEPNDGSLHPQDDLTDEDCITAQDDAESDEDYTDEEEKRVREEAKVAGLIKQAEEAAVLPSHDSKKRAYQTLKGSGTKDSTTDLVQVLDTTIEQIDQSLQTRLSPPPSFSCLARPSSSASPTLNISNPLTSLPATLTITKPDFSRLHIVGQFNLGFILATRNNKELFIIDQHASDEKINFERLQSTTVMQNQRLVRPLPLELTAVDEELILDNQEALMGNGFEVDVDTSGDCAVGQRCRLVTLPMSKEVTFDPSDLEELLALLSDTPSSTTTTNTANKTHLPRPSKIRRLFAMRACRSSIMIGKPLTKVQMRNLVRKLGGIDKPWNCPHGRPTMRHVCGLEGLGGWGDGREDAGLVVAGEEADEEGVVDWGAWVQARKGMEEEGMLGELEDEVGSEEEEEVESQEENEAVSEEEDEGV